VKRNRAQTIIDRVIQSKWLCLIGFVVDTRYVGLVGMGAKCRADLLVCWQRCSGKFVFEAINDTDRATPEAATFQLDRSSK